MKQKDITWSDPIQQAAHVLTTQLGIHAEIIQKKFPANGVLYVRLFTDDGREEWSLLDPDSDYDKAYAILQRQAQRLREGAPNGF